MFGSKFKHNNDESREKGTMMEVVMWPRGVSWRPFELGLLARFPPLHGFRKRSRGAWLEFCLHCLLRFWRICCESVCAVNDDLVVTHVLTNLWFAHHRLLSAQWEKCRSDNSHGYRTYFFRCTPNPAKTYTTDCCSFATFSTSWSKIIFLCSSDIKVVLLALCVF